MAHGRFGETITYTVVAFTLIEFDGSLITLDFQKILDFKILI